MNVGQPWEAAASLPLWRPCRPPWPSHDQAHPPGGPDPERELAEARRSRVEPRAVPGPIPLQPGRLTPNMRYAIRDRMHTIPEQRSVVYTEIMRFNIYALSRDGQCPWALASPARPRVELRP